jgi:hypothetical protein
MKRRRHLPTVGMLQPRRSAIARLLSPAAAHSYQFGSRHHRVWQAARRGQPHYRGKGQAISWGHPIRTSWRRFSTPDGLRSLTIITILSLLVPAPGKAVTAPLTPIQVMELD